MNVRSARLTDVVFWMGFVRPDAPNTRESPERSVPPVGVQLLFRTDPDENQLAFAVLLPVQV